MYPNVSTNSSNATRAFFMNLWDDFHKVLMATCAFEIIFSIVGTFLNVWFLVAILTSQDHRSRLRNKVICNMLILLLLDTALLLPLHVVQILGGRWVYRTLNTCTYLGIYYNLLSIQEFIANWLVVIMISIFIAQIVDFDPKVIFTPLAITIGTWAILLAPWLLSTLVIPVIVHDSLSRRKEYETCFLPTGSAFKIFRILDAIIPLLVSGIVLAVACILRYRRYNRGRMGGAVHTELMSRGPEIDNIAAYILAFVVSLISDVFRVWFVFHPLALKNFGYIAIFRMEAAAFGLTDARVILMPLVWLFLRDVRERIKVWRPWYRPPPGIDLTVTYQKHDA